jgi:hypothetical protein
MQDPGRTHQNGRNLLIEQVLNLRHGLGNRIEFHRRGQRGLGGVRVHPLCCRSLTRVRLRNNVSGNK